MTSRIQGVKLEPLDVLFFRDGRPFGAASRASTGLPMPQTFAGAIQTALLEQAGCDFAGLHRLVKQETRSIPDAIETLCGAGWIAGVGVRGPWFARRQNQGADAPRSPEAIEVLVPVPATLNRNTVR